MTTLTRPRRRSQATDRSVTHPGAGNGFSLIEVLVALVITALGLLGLAALQAKLQLSEIESYQRTQALLLVQDMADRIATNRKNASAYVTAAGSALGTGDASTSDCSALTSTALRDRCEWSKTLQGAAETLGTDKRGAMVSARGCVEAISTTSYLVTVVWQGLSPVTAPAGLTCGTGHYDGTSGSVCTQDRCRRAFSTVLRIGTLK